MRNVKFYSFRAFFHSQTNDSIISTKSCFCDSTQSILGDKCKTSLMINQLECERCKNLLRNENRRSSLCGDCVEQVYSPKTCSSCNGRISFQDLKNLSSQQNVNKKHFNEFVDQSSLKLCNCFPKYPSQHLSSIHPNDPNEIQILPPILGKAGSYNEMILTHQKKINPPFHSHNCLSTTTNSSSDESLSDED